MSTSKNKHLKVKIVVGLLAIYFGSDICPALSQHRAVKPLAQPWDAAARLAQSKLSKNDHLGAINTWSEVIEKYPTRYEPLYQRALILRAIGDTAGALDDLDKALEINPNNANALIQRAILKHKINDIKPALADIEKAVSLSPKSAPAYVERSSIKYVLGDFQGAFADYNTAVTLNPELSKNVNKLMQPQTAQINTPHVQGSVQTYPNKLTLDKLASEFKFGTGANAGSFSSTVVNASNSGSGSNNGALTNVGNSNTSSNSTGGNTTGSTGSNAITIDTTTGVATRSRQRTARTASQSAVISAGSTAQSTPPTAVISTEQQNTSDINTLQSVSALPATVTATVTSSSDDTPAQLAHQNNQAAHAINNKEFARAVDILQRLLDKHPEYSHARDNLVIAHNNWGLAQAVRKPEAAAQQFRAALFVDSSQAAARRNLNSLITEMGKDPHSPQDRLELADKLLASQDSAGAYVEVAEACRLRNTRENRLKLAQIIAAMDHSEPVAHVEKSVEEAPIAAAAPVHESPPIVAQTPAPEPVAITVKNIVAESPSSEPQDSAPDLDMPPPVQAYDQQSIQSRLESAPEEVFMVAKQFAAEGNYIDAEQLLLKILQRPHTADDTRLEALNESVLETLISINQKLNRLDKAESHLRQLVKMQERSRPQDDPHLGKTLAEYAQALRANGKEQEALKQETRANMILGRISARE